jgi:hypothetical protein
MTWPLRPLYGDVWCLTCEHVHVPVMPAVTFRCSDCGYGGWIVQVAEHHAHEYDDHIVYPVHHQTIPMPAERPVPATDDDGYPELPTGWSMVVSGKDGQIIAGWTDAGVFHQYATAETIADTLVSYLQDAIHV